MWIDNNWFSWREWKKNNHADYNLIFDAWKNVWVEIFGFEAFLPINVTIKVENLILVEYRSTFFY